MVLFNLSTSNEGINVSRVYGLSSFKVSLVITCKISVTLPVTCNILFDPVMCYIKAYSKGVWGVGGGGGGRGKCMSRELSCTKKVYFKLVVVCFSFVAFFLMGCSCLII